MPRINPNHQEPPSQAGSNVARLLVSVEEAAEALGMGRTTIFKFIRDGLLKSIKIGKRRMVPVAELQAFVTGSTQKGA